MYVIAHREDTEDTVLLVFQGCCAVPYGVSEYWICKNTVLEIQIYNIYKGGTIYSNIYLRWICLNIIG